MRKVQALLRPQTWLLAVTLGAAVVAGAVGLHLGNADQRPSPQTGWDIYYAERDCIIARGWELAQDGSSYVLGDNTQATRSRFDRDSLACAKSVGASK